MTRCILVALIAFPLGFYTGYKFCEAQYRWEHEYHTSVCESNKKYHGHAAYDTDGSKMCFQQSKLSGRIERVSLVVTGL